VSEILVLDPSEVAGTRRELVLADAMISRVAEGGPDWGDATIEAFMAENGQIGSLPIDFAVPNRQVTIPLLLKDDSSLTFDELRSQTQAIVGLWQAEGGWIKRELGDGRKLYLDVVNASLKLGGSTAQALYGIDADAVLSLEVLPGWYGDEIEGRVHSGVGEVSFLMGADFASIALEYEPALYWRLGTLTGLTDITGNGHNGTAAGGVVIGTAVGMLSNDSDEATDFDGSNDRITSSYRPFVRDSRLTFCGLASRDLSGSIDTLFGSDSTTVGAWVRLHLAAGSSGDVTFTVNGGTNSVTWRAAWPGNAQTVFWALTFDEAADTAELFINGASKGTASVTQAYNASPGGFVLGARSAGSDPFDGKLDEAMVFERILYPQEITMLHRASQSEPSVQGAFPLGNPCRLAVTDASGADQLGIAAAFRGRNFDHAATAALSYEAEALTPLDLASVTTLAGSSSGSAVLHSNLSTTWTPVLGVNPPGAFLTHEGSYQVLARVQSPQGTRVHCRFVWDVGDLVIPSENSAVQIPGANNFYIIDLGQVILKRPPRGSHRWAGQIQARGEAGGEDIYIDRIRLLPTDDFMAKLSTPTRFVEGLADYQARDEFNQSAGNLTGKTASFGGVWRGFGDADDFTVSGASSFVARRTAVSDVDLDTGRYVVVGPPLTDQVVRCGRISVSSMGSAQRAAVLARYVDDNNWLMGGWTSTGGGAIEVLARVGGSVRTLYQDVNFFYSYWWTSSTSGFILDVDEAGIWILSMVTGSSAYEVASGQSDDLKTGGALAAGQGGLYDARVDAGASTRTFDGFSVTVKPTDAVLYGSRSADLTTSGHFRDSEDGSAQAPVSFATGNLPRLPCVPTVEAIVKSSRGDLDRLPDTAIDALTAQLFYRPCWPTVPD
jgi:hypothetical protein